MGNVLPLERNLTTRYMEDPIDQIEKSRLSGPVRPDQGPELPCADRERDVVDGQ
jgi:hypothetical protein